MMKGDFYYSLNSKINDILYNLFFYSISGNKKIINDIIIWINIDKIRDIWIKFIRNYIDDMENLNDIIMFINK